MHRILSRAAPGPRHPFRQALIEGRRSRARARDAGDVRLFALSFAAFFTCFYTFLF